ncbi:pleuromutilin/lincosamide/streptogramin A transport system ATP-binding/permease protein [Scopulibacillus daqui]|uniref:Pleuromutilin/lincosamide/streptogramin A transport system ATP-binding/permease protein n=1 Tax=Scopulibacillus daqui TaxID=1469162 RepID=A0ABS2PXG4_9BACL|nr:ABC-F type ribosomal protection protein [Scopulibacillus daqui]MBM7644556.1 pleuromutilin/lincosamide/streptogramin A transport system ATP-binding/permease protein [Scopulibacillus daqui]
MIILEANHIEKSIKDRKLFGFEQLRIQDRERIGLVGRNGSGKTTLLNILAGQSEADEGTIMTSATRYLLPQLKEAGTVRSGGEITKRYIDKALAAKPDILFADEPSTNLDAESIERLEGQFKRFQGAIVLVSHDRYLLDQLCTKIWEIEDGHVREFTGHYTQYLEQKELLRQQEREKYEQYTAKKKQLEQAAQLKEQKAKKMTKAPSKHMGTSESRLYKMKYAKKQKMMHQNIKALKTRIDKLEKVEKPRELPPIKMDLPDGSEIQGRRIIQVKDFTMKINEKVLWREASFDIKGGEKVAVIGKNGAGKTTLLKQILARVPEVMISPAVKIGYFSQNLDILNPEKNILENVKATAIYPEALIRTVLARLHFYEEEVFKPVKALSGGERVKAAFAKVFLGDMNVLVMDEPTNFLDIHAMEALEDLLSHYEGTVIFVSHDRRFIENIAAKMIEIEDQSITVFTGNYKEYRESRQESSRDFARDELLKIETKLTEVISKLSEHPSETLEQEFQRLIAERKSLKENLTDI